MNNTEKSSSIVKTKDDARGISDRSQYFIAMIFLTLLGFFVGKIEFNKPQSEVITEPISQTIPHVNLVQRNGDEIVAEISGNVKLTWGDSYVLEESGSLFFGQIPTADDVKLSDFFYLANAKTKKFYPANSYPARGTEVRYRRFFQTKDEAIAAGFVPSKLVK